MTKKIFFSHVFHSVLFVYFQDLKSDDVLGHIYAEI